MPFDGDDDDGGEATAGARPIALVTGNSQMLSSGDGRGAPRLLKSETLDALLPVAAAASSFVSMHKNSAISAGGTTRRLMHLRTTRRHEDDGVDDADESAAADVSALAMIAPLNRSRSPSARAPLQVVRT